jgi:transposase
MGKSKTKSSPPPQEPKRPPGRPSKLTPELTAAIASDVEAGLFAEASCEAHGIGTTTYHRWMAENHAFRAIIKASERRIQHTCLSRIKEGGEGWQGSAWIMERRFPKRWAMRVKSAILDREDELYRLLKDGLDEATYAKVIHVLAGESEEGTPEGATVPDEGAPEAP